MLRPPQISQNIKPPSSLILTLTRKYGNPFANISIEEHSKRTEFCSHFDVKSMAAILDLCSIHEKPFEIVCI